MFTISRLFIYPIKSLRPIELTKACVEFTGLQWDRRWMLIDENNRCITQREIPQLTLLQPVIEEDKLLVYSLAKPNVQPLEISLDLMDNGQHLDVLVFDDPVTACHISSAYDEWFSNEIGQKCRLVYMSPEKKRPVAGYDASVITSFSDAYPILVLGNSALEGLNIKLESPVSILRFRPNIVFKGGTPHIEDTWKEIQINQHSFYGLKQCKRCAVPNVNPSTGQNQIEPNKTLATYRRFGNGIYFGVNMIPRVSSEENFISIGDQIQVIS